jgi:ABC-type glucose/galactose transport system permease subunit
LITLGIVLLVLGYLLPIPLVTTLGVILIVIGVILLLLGTVGGRPVGGRAHWL